MGWVESLDVFSLYLPLYLSIYLHIYLENILYCQDWRGGERGGMHSFIFIYFLLSLYHHTAGIAALFFTGLFVVLLLQLGAGQVLPQQCALSTWAQ